MVGEGYGPREAVCVCENRRAAIFSFVFACVLSCWRTGLSLSMYFADSFSLLLLLWWFAV